MGTKDSVEVVQQLHAIINSGKLGFLDSVVAEDVIDHASLPYQAPGLDGFKQHLITFRHRYAEPNLEIEDISTEHDHVRWSWTAEYVPQASNASVTLRGISTERVQQGKIVEHWSSLTDTSNIPVHDLAQAIAPLSA